jgi:hypothetical protein
MSLFVEVNSVDKGCPVIINLDHVIEIAPLTAGGCALFMVDTSNIGAGAKSSFRVTENYDMFKQFAMQTVTAEDIAKRFPKAEKPKATDELEIPTLGKPKK